MNPYQQVTRSWPMKVKQKCFDLYCQRMPAPEISEVMGVPRCTINDWSCREKWSQYRHDVVTSYVKRAEMIGQASIVTALNSLTASSKVLSKVHTCLDSETPLKPAEIASIASALTDSTELLCRLLGK